MYLYSKTYPHSILLHFKSWSSHDKTNLFYRDPYHMLVYDTHLLQHILN